VKILRMNPDGSVPRDNPFGGVTRLVVLSFDTAGPALGQTPDG
jgi:hypothetical protein